MFTTNGSVLETHLQTSSTIKSQSAIIAEWNLNYMTNIDEIGNYFYNPQVGGLTNTFAKETFSTSSPKYYGGTDSNVSINAGYNSDGTVASAFTKAVQREKLLYSLEDCLGRFRPRSGINKARYFSGNYTHHTYSEMATRPRYYMSSKNDTFKYWSSYRTKYDSTTGKDIQYGIAQTSVAGNNTAPYYISDVAPFVTYKTQIPANRIVIKMQTNVGTTDLGNITLEGGTTVADPLYGTTNKTTPVTWKVQVLQGTTWTDATSFTSDIVPTDGYVELSYGISNIPVAFVNNFVYAEEYSDASLLPSSSVTGYAYLVRTGTAIGQYYVWNGSSYTTFTPTYSWYQSTEGLSPSSVTVTDLVYPASYVSGTTQYREFQYIQGIRIVVDTMNKSNSIFDLIEMSPRLVADLSEITMSYSVNKIASDLASSGLPVGQLLASNGSLTLFDVDQAFNPSNTSSIINAFSSINLQIKFYEIISQVSGVDYYVPIKTYYAEGFPQINNENREVSINLRDLFFYFESMKAPQLFIRNASLSYIISTLMDSIGFSNYTFRRNAGETEEPIIPNFIVRPDATIAQVLNELASSTQYAMFFDEYNNFVVMSRNRIMPTATEKATDITLIGSLDASDTGVIKNYYANGTSLANIVNIASTTKDIFNDGKISYTQKYIQRDRGSIAEATQLPEKQHWVYRPALLWEVSGTENVRPTNADFGNQSSYALGAIPLNTTLTNTLPYVDNNKEVQNNTINLGEAIYWLPRYKGYFYANGEIIKYDAVQYAVDGIGKVWITSGQEYEQYFQTLPFGGFIYPTGLVRIFTEPYYTSGGVIDDSKPYTDTNDPTYTYYNGTTRGAVAKHGRGQFGTKIVTHEAGLSNDWKSNYLSDNGTTIYNVYGCYMESKYLFNTNTSRVYNGTTTTIGSTTVKDTFFTNTDENTTMVLDNTISGKTLNGYSSDDLARNSSINGIIKDFLSSDYDSETSTPVKDLDSAVPGTMQSSALVFNGIQFSSTSPLDFLSYVYKPLTDSYNYFGTRMRIIGKLDNMEKTTTAKTQTPIGGYPMFTIEQKSSDEPKIISGSSGGMAIMVNKDTNVGYFFEIVALTSLSTETATGNKDLANVYFYKNLAVSGAADTAATIPVQLYSGLTNILVDDGLFTGQSKMLGDKDTSVYDLAIEYEKIPHGLRFYLTINNNVIAIVEDTEPLPILNNMALFVRGSSKCMFENVYAIALDDQYGKSSGTSLISNAEPFALDNPDAKFESYGINRVVRNTFLTQVNPLSPPKYKFYYNEFGTIMRECSYFNIRYDKAYPALLAKISPTYNKFKGYAISGFTPNAYGAEFMVFNTTDTVLNLDETSGNYLRIQGVTFTQESTHDLTIDEYFSKKTDFSNPSLASQNGSPLTAKQTYIDIMNSRSVYGKKDFVIDGPYIQNADNANKLMDWLVTKVMKPRKSVGLEIFPTPIMQLGDIVQVSYTDKNSVEQISASSRFVVYNIEYSRDGNGPSMTVYLSEVI